MSLTYRVFPNHVQVFRDEQYVGDILWFIARRGYAYKPHCGAAHAATHTDYFRVIEGLRQAWGIPEPEPKKRKTANGLLPL